jgi:cytochrome c-type biogenesis protein CcsB
MEEVSRIQNEVFTTREKEINAPVPGWKSYLPAGLALAGAFLMLGLRLQIGSGFVSDTALMMLALACYILAALFELTNLYAPSEMAKKIGLWSATLGVFFNLASWLVRWVNAYEFELIQLQASGNNTNPWIFRYIPFANLYDLSLAFAFGAGITTLFLAHRKNFQFLSAFTLPLAALILTLARFIGGEHSNLMPILDSYWRPIHVGVASLSYGIALVCFAIAVVYLLKDKIKVEAMAIFSSLFAIAVIGSISGASVFTNAAYRAGTFIPNLAGGKSINAFFRFELPYVGTALLIAGLLLLGSIISFLIYIYGNESLVKQEKAARGEIEEKATLGEKFAENKTNILIAGIAMITTFFTGFGVVRRNAPKVESGDLKESEAVEYNDYQTARTVGYWLLRGAFIVQILAVAFWVSGIKTTTDVQAQLQAQLAQNPAQYIAVGKEIASKQQLSVQQMAAITPAQFEQAGRQFFQQNGSKMFLSLNTNPVEFAGLLTALAGTFFVLLFSFRTEKLRERLPSLESLDSMMYKTACLAFAGLAMLLITGAIWANESWGRPWGFDSKETGALVAWLTYAAFLHTRISRGWKGRSSAYFAIIGFLLVIFTYLGVSYLLPGLHSYA